MILMSILTISHFGASYALSFNTFSFRIVLHNKSSSMKCHHCDKQATVHLTQILNGQMHKMDLCESCAQAKGVTNPENLSISNLMDKVELEVDTSGTSMVCESCGITHQEFKKGGRLGCEACYHVFRPVLDPLLDGMHAGTRHLGKVPAGSESRIHLEQSIGVLKKKLQDAVEKEDFEEAASLRDELRDLQNESHSVSS
jgi:protein arginine kinase activator